MARVSFPPGVSKAAVTVPHLEDLSPHSPPAGPLPIPYPNTAHFENFPAGPVVDALFGQTDIDVVGAPSIDHWLV